MPRSNFRAVELPVELKVMLDERADLMDLPTAKLVVGALRGAIRLGSLERLVAAGLEGTAVKRRNRATERFWTPTAALERRNGPYAPRVWVHGPYRLSRVGRARGLSRPEEPGNGWWVEGPGVPRTYVGMQSPEARRDAEAIVRRAGCDCPGRAG